MCLILHVHHAYKLFSVPVENHGEGAQRGTEAALHWHEGFQDGKLRAIECI